MNKLFLLSLFLVFSFCSALGQNIQPPKRYRLGLIGGKTITGSHQQDTPWVGVSGGFVGADISYAFAKDDPNFTLRLQPNFESFRYQSPGELVVNGNGNYRINLNSLDIPGLVRLAIPAGKRVSPFVELGANYKIRVRGRVEARRVLCGFASCNESVFEDDFTAKELRNDVSLLAGVGAEFHWGGVTIPVSIRVNGGLGQSTIKGENGSENAFSLIDLNSKTLQVVTGVSF